MKKCLQFCIVFFMLVFLIGGFLPGEANAAEETIEQGQTFEFYYEQGKKLGDAGKYEKGRRYLEKAVMMNPQDFQANDYLGTIYFQLGDNENAIKYKKIADAIDPNNYALSMFLGTIYYEIGDLYNALTYFEKSILIHSNREPAYIAAGVTNRLLGNMDSAFFYLQQGLAYFPHSPTLNYEIAIIYQVEKKDLDKALSHVLRALQQREQGDYYLTLGSIYFRKGKFSRAREELERAMKLLKKEGDEEGYTSALRIYEKSK